MYIVIQLSSRSNVLDYLNEWLQYKIDVFRSSNFFFSTVFQIGDHKFDARVRAINFGFKFFIIFLSKNKNMLYSNATKFTLKLYYFAIQTIFNGSLRKEYAF